MDFRLDEIEDNDIIEQIQKIMKDDILTQNQAMYLIIKNGLRHYSSIREVRDSSKSSNYSCGRKLEFGERMFQDGSHKFDHRTKLADGSYL